MKEEKKMRMLILALVFIIVALAGVVAYAFAIRPAFTGYAVNAYNGGVQDAILAIMQRAVQCQQVPLTFQNQTINLVAVECLQQLQQQQETEE